MIPAGRIFYNYSTYFMLISYFTGKDPDIEQNREGIYEKESQTNHISIFLYLSVVILYSYNV